MKRFVVIVLSIVLVLSLSISAFAATSDGVATNTGGAAGGPSLLLGIYNSSDKKITVIPAKDIGIFTIYSLDKIPENDQIPFLKASEEAGNITDRTIRSLYYLWIPESYKQIDGFAYVRYPFTCAGKNITFTVNGKEMEVCPISENSWYAKLTEFGTILITCD